MGEMSNPWLAPNYSAFVQFICPELDCNFLTQSSVEFENHGMSCHKAKFIYPGKTKTSV